MLDIARSNGYAIQTVYTHAVKRYVDTGPMMEMGRKGLEMGRKVLEMQAAMARDMKQLLEAQLKFRQDLDKLRAEIRRQNESDEPS